jgi:putative endonuclease
MYYFYILISDLDMKYYYGSTKDLINRFKQHQNGEVTSTKCRRPLRLVYYEAYTTRQKAVFREKQVKNSGAVRANLHKRI